ncbi:MAG: hypothetical protein QNL04_08215 [SAR324 cluster bacterium]|nr:hypothetical protein [SAR324 cluster bacterium]
MGRRSDFFLILFFLVLVSSFSGATFAQDAGGKKRQINNGIVNYGYVENVYAQFSGRDDLFADGNSPVGYFSNFSLQILEQLPDFEYPTGYSYGFEFMQFSSDSSSVYSGGDSVDGPAINMSLQVWSFTLRSYFADFYSSTVQPFFGIGWGWINGEFSSVDGTNGISARTNLIGLMTYQTYGAIINIQENFGVTVELRNLRAESIAASNDPFSQSANGNLLLNFSGTMLNFTMLYRF